jgi:hypothetical protein
MKVTDKALVAACKSFYGDLWGFAQAEAMRDALTAALADVPDMQLALETASKGLRAKNVRIKELETKLEAILAASRQWSAGDISLVTGKEARDEVATIIGHG